MCREKDILRIKVQNLSKPGVVQKRKVKVSKAVIIPENDPVKEAGIIRIKKRANE